MRVGFLGAGLIARFHAGGLKASGEDFTWAGVHDPDPARAAAFAAATGATPAATEDEVLDGCDAVYICTWTSEHPRLVEAACRRGLAVFCEKPLATTLAGARAMADTAGAAGVVAMVGLVMRRSPAFNQVARLVQDPAAGALQSIVFRDDQHLPTSGMYASTWRADVDKAGAGTLLEHSIHDVDLLEWIAGPIDRVSARSANHHGLAGIEDTVVTAFGHEGGGLSTLTSVWHDIAERPSQRRVEVFCERRWISLEGDWFGPVRWRTTGDPGGEQVLEGEALLAAVAGTGAQTDGSQSADAAFLRAAREGAPSPSPTFAEAVAAHEVVDAVYRSAAAGGAAVTVRGESG